MPERTALREGRVCVRCWHKCRRSTTPLNVYAYADGDIAVLCDECAVAMQDFNPVPLFNRLPEGGTNV